MASELLEYVEGQLKKGYSPDAVRNTLIRDGYSPGLVDGVVESVLKKRVRAGPAHMTSHMKKGMPKIIFVIIFLVIVILGAVFIPGMIKKDALLDIITTPDKNSFEQGEKLGFEVEIFNMGSADRFDITLDYRLLDENDNKILGREKTIAISTSTSHHETIDLPASMNPGNYVLKVFANYEEKIAVSSFSFEVVEKASSGSVQTCYDNKQNQDETGPDCGGVCGGYWYDSGCHSKPKGDEPEIKETCTDGIKNQNEHHTDCGGVCKNTNGDYWYDYSCHKTPESGGGGDNGSGSGPITYVNMMSDARAAAEENPEKAKKICLDWDIVSETDKCLREVAQIAKENEICDLIQGDNDRDICYLAFFIDGDYSVCDKVTNPDSRNACEQLRDLSP